MIFSFGDSENERIEINVLGCGATPADDDHWLPVRIRVHAGGFSGDIEAMIVGDDLNRFLSQLRPLYESLSGSAIFSTMEEQLRLRLVGDGRGHVDLTGEVADRAGDGNRLHFRLQFDQSQLRGSIRELERVTSQVARQGANPGTGANCR